MKDQHHFNVVVETRDDNTKVWKAKCLRCDTVIVGEAASEIPVVQATNHLPPIHQQKLGQQVRKAWLDAKAGGYPFVLPSPDFTITTLPDHGLQRALDAHADSCMPPLAKDYK